MNYQEAKAAFARLFRGEMPPEEAKAMLVEMYERGESVDEITAAAEVMRAHAIKLPVSEDLRPKLIDNCGTGGDRSGSFNISTTVSLLLAGAGCHVAKHGNRSITSRSGSADMLEALGVRLDLAPEQQVRMLEDCGFTFIFAIHHHPAMKFVMPIRKSIPHRTIFNILGPLTNPAGVRKQLIGVFSPDYLTRIAEALKRLGSERAMVVSSHDGMDEISVRAPTGYRRLENGDIAEGLIEPGAYGIGDVPPEALKGGDARENAAVTRAILYGEERGPKRDVVLLNAAAALTVDGRVPDMQAGMEMAAETLDSGRAAAALEKIVEVSNRL